jgi:hypothetical protein
VKYYSESSLNNQHTLTKWKTLKVKSVLSKIGYQWESRLNREGEGGHGKCTLHMCEKWIIKPAEIVLRSGLGEMTENDGGGK